MDPRIEKVLKLPASQRMMILAGWLVLIIAGFLFVLFFPKQEEYKTLLSTSQARDAKLQEDRRIAADLPKFRAEYEKMQKQLEDALTELPNAREIPTLLTSISSLAKDNGLTVQRFRPGKENPKGFYAEVPVDLNLVGSFHEVAMFFNAVGSLSRIVNINNVVMGGAKQEGGRMLLTVDCVATTFRFVEGTPTQPTPARGK